ncbi:hypothetical protein AB0F17_43795 [Nonomuraea sp. NPDC026600]|uniref:hypothetical protein n=1 Tax=Nonomuraea sp. NPDC026600 TaxID=3155363 RepID=UPI0033FA1DE3
MAEDEQPAEPTGEQVEQETGSDGQEEPAAATPRKDVAADKQKGGHTQSERKAVYNTFLGSVNMGGSMLGFGEGGAGGDGESGTGTSATGRLSPTLVEAACACYIAPEEPYEAAREALLDDRVVALVGAAGIGKRTGSVVLLREILGGDHPPIISLAPSATLDELRKRDYERGYGYAVFDRTGDRRALLAPKDDKADTGWADSDHGWQSVSEKVHEAGAYLVVTTGPAAGRPPEAVRHVTWERPALAEVLRKRLDAGVHEEKLTAMVALLPEECAMADLVRVAQRVSAGSEPVDAVNDVLDQSGRREVRLWFDRAPSRREILDVTTLAFVTGVGDRAFEICRDLLERSLSEVWPAPRPAKKPAEETHLQQDRAERLSEDGLIRFVRDNTTGWPHRTLAFREDSYRRYVLEELSERFRSAFWDAVKGWLDQLVVLREFSVDVAAGLALLSYTTFDEINYSYLEPWSLGENGWEGQVAAAYVLWFMSLDEALGPVALRTAEWWAGQGSTPQRLTAILAFQGELGIRYPTAAAKRLWQLLVQQNQLSEVAANAFGDFFAALVSAREKVGNVVKQLRSQLDDAQKTGKGRLRYELTLVAIVSVLWTRAPRTGNPASMEYLRDNPDRRQMIAEMWAAVLRYRPYRHDGLIALLDALNSLERLSGANAEHDARALGDALGAALPVHEHEPFKRDFTNLIESSRKKPPRAAALTKVLLAALDRASKTF